MKCLEKDRTEIADLFADLMKRHVPSSEISGHYCHTALTDRTLGKLIRNTIRRTEDGRNGKVSMLEIKED
jgi:hypothetical protein